MEATQLKESSQPQADDLQDEDIVEERLRAELATQINDYVDQLSVERLRGIVDLMAYLKDKEEEEATEELLAIPNFERDLLEAERNIREGRSVDWRTVRDDV